VFYDIYQCGASKYVENIDFLSKKTYINVVG